MAEELARIKASVGRRYLGVGTLLGLGVLLIYVAFNTPPASFGWQVFLIALGATSLWCSQVMWKATSIELILTDEGLSDSTGEVLAHIDNIERVNRGMFAAKPSNGFTILLKAPGSRVWRPGIWWRLGRRVAVGGVTAGHQTRPVADILTHKVAELANT
ncbi:MAG: hypothetical protein QNJ09_18420 [Paracoccaceae bacterium]|nr:hypothetical protein [Paracoccaceae bacterium]